MVDQGRAQTHIGRNTIAKKPLRYFYLNGQLHKKLQINRGADTIMTWCYPLHKRVAYTYTDVKKRMEPAFTTQEVVKMLNRTRKTIQWLIIDGAIEPPQRMYALNADKKPGKYMWSEESILEAHAALSARHYGRPRHDGFTVPKKLPTVRELRAIIRQKEILYVKVGDEFKPVWDAEDFD